jgi:hypothetical protein
VIKKHISYKTILLRAGFLLHACCLLSGTAHARGSADTVGFTVFSNAAMYVLDKAQVGILSDVNNNGVFGSVPGTIINMSGAKWTNGTGASFPDEFGVTSFSGSGGLFRFISNNRPQSFFPNFSLAGKTGASLPNLTIANPFGVTLEGADAHVRNTLHFENGIIWVNGNNLLIGTNGPGTITGYSDKNFVATGNTTKGGSLYRAKISGASGNVIFPIGPQAGSYSPLSIMFNAATPQDLHARAFDDVYRNAFIGTKGNPLSVQQTWNIGQENTIAVPSIVAIQHNESREGAAFTAHRADSYIALYDFVKRAYDTLPPSGISSGTFTSGPALSNAYINLRVFDSIGQSSYLSKTSHLTADSLTLGKGALYPVRQPDGSFIVTYQFFVRNDGLYRADSLQILDSLDKVFKSSMSFTVGSVTATGNLKVNAGFDGVTNTNLLLNTSTLAPNITDTVTLVLNVRISSKEEYFYNTAIVGGVLNGYNNSQYLFKNGSVNGFAPPLPGARPVPTPIVLTEAKYVLPHGFSPNGDGINDYFIIGNLGTSKAALWIFDKNGVYVYKNMNYQNDWTEQTTRMLAADFQTKKLLMVPTSIKQ